MKDGGVIQTRTIPKEIQDLLASGGCAVTGITSYNIVSSLMEKAVDNNGKPKFSETETQFVSIITALGIAMASYGIIKKLVE